jgi:hypothetical protein
MLDRDTFLIYRFMPMLLGKQLLVKDDASVLLWSLE